MARAVKYAVVRDTDGTEVRLKGGAEHFTSVADDDPLVKRYPHLFVLDGGDGPRARARPDRMITRVVGEDARGLHGRSTQAPPRSGLKHTFDPWPLVRPHREDLRHEPWRLVESAENAYFDRSSLSPVPVLLTSAARADLLRVLGESSERDGLEVAGILVGAIGDDAIQVARASGPGPRALRWPDAVRLHHGDVYDLMAAGAGLGFERGFCIGWWHCHVRGWSGAAPSGNDLRFGARWRRMLGLPQFVQIIAVPKPGDGWVFEPLVHSPFRSGDMVQRAELVSVPDDR